MAATASLSTTRPEIVRDESSLRTMDVVQKPLSFWEQVYSRGFVRKRPWWPRLSGSPESAASRRRECRTR